MNAHDETIERPVAAPRWRGRAATRRPGGGAALDAGARLLVAVHLEACPVCRARVATLEALGGALLESLPAAPLRSDALERTLRAAESGAGPDVRPDSRPDSPPAGAPMATAATARRAPSRPPLPPGMAWPRALAGCTASRWRWIAPGMRWSRVRLPDGAPGNVVLLRIAAGESLASHTHSGAELTQVLYGSFDDGRSRFAPGDFDTTDATIRHQPVVTDDGECICIASVDGRLVFDGWMARTVAGWMGL